MVVPNPSLDIPRLVKFPTFKNISNSIICNYKIRIIIGYHQMEMENIQSFEKLPN